MRTPWNDRAFVDASLTIAVGPLELPPVSGLKDVLRQVARADPASPALLAYSDGRRRVRTADELEAVFDRLVVVEPGPDDLQPHLGLPTGGPEEQTPDEIATTLWTQRQGLPEGDLGFQLQIAGRYAVVKVRHEVGDARTLNALSVELISRVGGAPPDTLMRATSPGIVRALGGALLLGARSGQLSLTRATRADPGPESHAVWRPAARVVHGVLGPEELREIKVKARALGVSRASVVMTLFDAALEQTGLRPADDVRTVVVDCRRYVGAGRTVRGNFTVGQALAADWRDPVAVDARVRRTVDSGRPIVALGLSAALSAGKPVMAPAASSFAPTSLAASSFAPTVSYSFVGAIPGPARLAWDGEPTIIAGAGPRHPRSIEFVFVEACGTLQVTAAFDGGHVSPRALGDAFTAVGLRPAVLRQGEVA